EEGKVELKNLAAKTVLVESGHYAVAAAGSEFASIPSDDFVLTPSGASLTGSEWRLVKDSKASSGQALETIGAHPQKEFAGELPSFVTFPFTAEAGKDYAIWVNGCCMAPETMSRGDRRAHDSVVLDFPTGRPSPPCRYVGAIRPTACWFQGWAEFVGY